MDGVWGFGLGYGVTFINVGVDWWQRYYRRPQYYGGWWGPGGYRPVYRPLPGYRPRYRPPRNVFVLGNPGLGRRPRPGGGGTAPGARPHPRPLLRPDNIDARPVNTGRITTWERPAPTATPRPAHRPNNVYTDKSGNIFRREPDGSWKQRNNGGWTDPGTEHRRRVLHQRQRRPLRAPHRR